MSGHEHQFAEEETPDGARILFPCLICGMPAADAILQAQAERDEALSACAAAVPPGAAREPQGDTYCDEPRRCFYMWPTNRDSWCIGCKNLKPVAPAAPRETKS